MNTTKLQDQILDFISNGHTAIQTAQELGTTASYVHRVLNKTQSTQTDKLDSETPENYVIRVKTICPNCKNSVIAARAGLSSREVVNVWNKHLLDKAFAECETNENSIHEEPAENAPTEEKPKQETKTRKCQHCGEEVTKFGAIKFCPYCGGKLETAKEKLINDLTGLSDMLMNSYIPECACRVLKEAVKALTAMEDEN